MAHKLRDGDVPQDLKRVVSEQVGVQGFVRNLGTQGRVLSDLGTSILDLDGTAAGDNGMKLLPNRQLEPTGRQKARNKEA